MKHPAVIDIERSIPPTGPLPDIGRLSQSVVATPGVKGARTLGFAGATALHLLVFAVLFVRWQATAPVMALPEPAVSVLMAAPSSPPQPVRDLAPGPQASEQREGSREPPKEELHRTDAPVPPELSRAVEAAPARPNEQGPTSAPAAQAAAPPATPAPPAARIASNVRDGWQGRVLAQLEKHRRYPGNARSLRVQGTAYVRFRMNRGGQVLSAAIQRSSGSAILDQAALATLRRAQPLPPIPPEMPDEVELAVPVEFYLSR